MTEQNPYATPNSELEGFVPVGDLMPADRWHRLGAAFIDGLLLLVLLWPLLYALGFVEVFVQAAQAGHRAPYTYTVASVALGLGLFALVHGFPLAANGQTWGKKFLKLKIVDLEGRKPSLLRLIALRYGLMRVFGSIPVVGPVYAIIDDLFIFRDDRRCIHDHIAGTRVVVAD